jgi:site-specific DNA recombinase
MNAAIYARVSTDRQGRDQTIDSQLSALRDWVSARGHRLRPEHVFTDEGHSGSRLDRPGLDRLRDAARDGEFDVLAVLSPDRLARKYAYQVLLLEEFRKDGCDVAFIQRPISDDPHDQLLLQIQGAIAEYERALLGDRFRRGKLQKARAGAWVSGRAPYGYRHVPAGDGVLGHLAIDEVEAELVRALYRWLIDERMTVRQILKRLAEGPWRPRCGRRLWSSAVVHRILADPVYTGTAYANRHETIPAARPGSRGGRPGARNGRRPRPREEWIAIPVPAIIDEPTRLAALAQLERNAALSFRNNTRNDYLLRCLLTCRTCGLAMFGTMRRGGAGKPRHRYYQCRGKDCVTRDPDRPCTQRVTKADELEEAVWGHVEQLLDDPAMLLGQFESLAREAEDRDAAGAETRKTEALLRRLDREEQRLLDAYQAEALSLEGLKARRQLLRGRRELLEAQAEQQAKLRAEREAARESWHDLEAFCGRVRSRLGEATVGEKQRILQLVIERVIVGEDAVEIRHVIPLRRPGDGATVRGTPDEPPEGDGMGEASSGKSGDGLRSDRVELAALPRHADQPGIQRLLQPGVAVADD